MTPETKIRIVVADDHSLIRKGLINLLEGAQDLVFVGEAEDGQEAIEQTEKLRPDVIIMDLSMPKVSGIEATSIIVKRFPETRVLVLTMHEKEQYVHQIIRSGASGYVLKNAGREELATAIRAVANGERFFSPRVSSILVEGYLRKGEMREDQSAHTNEVPLTKREREVLALVARGLTNQQIAEKLSISPRTVDTHRTNIMHKLGIHDIANLVRYAIDHEIT